MNKVLAVLVSMTLVITTTTQAYGETPVCTEPIALTSPCQGVLLPPSAASKGLNCLKVDVPKLELKILKMEELHALRVNSLNLILKAETDRATRIEGLLERSLEVKGGPTWYEHPVFWAVVGVVIGAGATIGIAYAINPATK
tara:strand:- start:346 stop:771 length:426 start_codon:yes stop_codon:yes gene_type:complete